MRKLFKRKEKKEVIELQIREIFVANLKAIMEARELNVNALARKADIEPRMVERWLTGKSVNLATLERIEKCCNVKFNLLWREK